jgi:hypothetical protein
MCDRLQAVLSESDTSRLVYLGRLHTLSFFSMYHMAGEDSFTIRPKHHYWEEMLLQTSTLRLNPKHLSCWGEESLLGRIKRIAQRCHGATMLSTSMKRYALMLSRRWDRRRETRRWFIGK